MTESIDGRGGKREANGRGLVTGGDLCLATCAGGSFEVDTLRSSLMLEPRRWSRRCSSISSVCALLCERMRSPTFYRTRLRPRPQNPRSGCLRGSGEVEVGLVDIIC